MTKIQLYCRKFAEKANIFLFSFKKIQNILLKQNTCLQIQKKYVKIHLKIKNQFNDLVVKQDITAPS